jgi:hypothetical protein
MADGMAGLGEITNVADDQLNRIETHQGRVLLLIQSTRSPAKITISARTHSLTSHPTEIAPRPTDQPPPTDV